MEDIKEIIKVFKCLEFETYEWNIYYDGKLQINCDTMTTYLDKLLNYIEQLEKENQKLKQQNKEFKINTISKNKIREDIRQLESYLYVGKNAPQDFLQYRIKAKIQALQDLLEV